MLMAGLSISRFTADDTAQEDSSLQKPTSGIVGTTGIEQCALPLRRSCRVEPHPASQIVRRVSDDKVVAKFQSDDDGSFKIALKPGEYLIVGGQNQVELGSLTPQIVRVPRFSFVEIRVVYTSDLQ